MIVATIRQEKLTNVTNTVDTEKLIIFKHSGARRYSPEAVRSAHRITIKTKTITKMKKNRTIIMLTVTMASMLSSCTGVEVEQKDNYKAKFTGGTSTRASGNIWDAGDQIGISMYGQDSGEVIEDYQNYCYDAATGGTSVNFAQKSGEMYFPYGYVHIDFYAYYPYKEGTTDKISIDTEARRTEDIMYAKKAWNAKNSGLIVPLQFEYKLAKVIVKIISGSGSPDISNGQVAVNYGYRQGTMDLTTGEITKTGTTTSTVTVFTSTGNSNEYYGLIIPQTLPSGSHLSVQVDGTSGTISLANSVFETNKVYTYNVTVNKDNVKLEGGATIADRETQQAVELSSSLM